MQQVQIPGLNPALTVITLATLLTGCTPDERDPRTFPYLIEPIATLHHKIIPFDLDSDGQDEIIAYNGVDAPINGDALNLQVITGVILEQTNVHGVLRRPTFLNLDDNLTHEIVLPFVRNDSLFIRFLNSTGQPIDSLGTLYLARGAPRRLDDTTYTWDPEIRHIERVDVTGDGISELVTVLTTGYAGRPRGVFIHSFPQGDSLGAYEVASAPQEVLSGDFDGDGKPELAFGTHAADNDVFINGTDDRHAHVFLFNLELPIPEPWSKEMGGLRTASQILVQDFDQDGKSEFLLTVRNNMGQNEPGRLFLMNPEEQHPYKETPITSFLIGATQMAAVRPGHSGYDILIVESDGTLNRFDENLTLVSRKRMPWPLLSSQWLTDMNQDGQRDLLVTTQNAVFIIDDELRLMAVYPRQSFQGYIKRGPGKTAWLYAERKNDTYIYQISPNRRYLFYRFSPFFGLLAAGGGLFLCSYALLQLRIARRRQELSRQRDKEAGLAIKRFVDLRRTVKARHAQWATTLAELSSQLEALFQHQPHKETPQENVRLFDALRLLQGEMQDVDSITSAPLKAHPEKAGFAEKLFALIDEQMADPDFNVSALAERMNMSERHLQRQCKAAALPTPINCIHLVRLQHAQRLLREDRLISKEIAAAIGFKNPDHFSVWFQGQTGQSPSTYHDLWNEPDI